MAGMNMKRGMTGAVMALFFLALVVIVVFPALRFPSWWGVHDWPQFYTYYGVPQRAVSEFHELPGWNPYFYGGNVQWGHPDDPTLSPLFLPLLIWGVVAGSKVNIVLVLAGGLWSMWLLGRRVGLSAVSAVFAAAVWGLNGWHAYHLAVGHMDHLTFLFQPLVLYFFLRSLKDMRWSVATGGVLAFMYLSGGPYPLVFSGVLLVVCGLIFAGRENNGKPVKAIMAAFVFGGGLMAIKMLSTMEFVLFAEGVPNDVSGTGVRVLWRALVESSLPMYSKYAGTQYGSWEYAAFVGYLPIGIFLLGTVTCARRAWPWLAMGGVFLVASFGAKSPVNFFALFTALPGLSGMHVPFRFIAHVMIMVAIVGGMGLDWMAAKLRGMGLAQAGTVLGAILVAGTTINLIWMHYDRPVSLYRLTAYLVPPAKYGGVLPEAPPYPMLEPGQEIYVPVTYDQALTVYVKFLESQRLSWGYDATRLPNQAKFATGEGYRGEAYLLRGDAGMATLDRSTLSSYRVFYHTTQDNTILLNQNYMPGWRLTGDERPAYERGGLVAVDVEAGSGEVEFAYTPRCRIAGALITLLTLIMSAFYIKARPPGAREAEHKERNAKDFAGAE